MDYLPRRSCKHTFKDLQRHVFHFKKGIIEFLTKSFDLNEFALFLNGFIYLTDAVNRKWWKIDEKRFHRCEIHGNHFSSIDAQPRHVFSDKLFVPEMLNVGNGNSGYLILEVTTLRVLAVLRV